MDTALNESPDSATSNADDRRGQRGVAPESYLVISGVAKKPNVHALLQAAAAFGVRQVLVVGQEKTLSEINDCKGCHASILHDLIQSGCLELLRFHKWDEAVTYLRRNSIPLIGIEIHQDAKTVTEILDGTSKAFVVGNEGDGLSAKQMQCCDGFVRIPQYGIGTASLNVAVAAGIILHRFYEYQRTLDQPSES